MPSAQPSPTELGEPDLILVRYGELALKKGNRGEFEKVLVRNLRQALASTTKAEVDRQHGRIFIRPERRCEKAAKRAAEVFGVKTVSPAWTVASDTEAITAGAVAPEANSPQKAGGLSSDSSSSSESCSRMASPDSMAERKSEK